MKTTIALVVGALLYVCHGAAATPAVAETANTVVSGATPAIAETVNAAVSALLDSHTKFPHATKTASLYALNGCYNAYVALSTKWDASVDMANLNSRVVVMQMKTCHTHFMNGQYNAMDKTCEQNARSVTSILKLDLRTKPLTRPTGFSEHTMLSFGLATGGIGYALAAGPGGAILYLTYVGLTANTIAFAANVFTDMDVHEMHQLQIMATDLVQYYKDKQITDFMEMMKYQS